MRAEQRINEMADKMALKSGGGHLYSGVDQELMLRKRRVDLGQMKKTASYNAKLAEYNEKILGRNINPNVYGVSELKGSGAIL